VERDLGGCKGVGYVKETSLQNSADMLISQSEPKNKGGRGARVPIRGTERKGKRKG